MRCLTLLFLTCLCQAQMLKLGPNQSISVPYPDVKTASQRFELRVAGFSVAPVDQPLPYSEDTHCRIIANSLILQCNSWDEGTPNGLPQVDLKGRADVRIRIQKDIAKSQISVEIWNGDGSGYRGDSRKTLNGPHDVKSGSIAITNGGISIAFFRWYTTTVPMNSRPPMDRPATPADRVNFLFSQGLADPAHKRVAALSAFRGGPIPACPGPAGSPCLVPSPVYKPIAIFAKWGVLPFRTFQTGESLALDGSESTTSTGDGSPTAYQWQQTGGPSQGKFSDTTSAKTQFSASTPGTYTIQLTVTDQAGNSGTATQTVGAVAVDSNGIVVTGNAALDRLLGPHIMWGKSPWLYHDWGEMALALQIGEQGAMRHPPTENATPIAGRVSFTNGGSGSVLKGAGTHFTTDLASSRCGGSPCTLFGAFTQGGRTIHVLLGTVDQITSDTSATLHGPYYWNGPTTNAVEIMRISDPSLLGPWGSTGSSGNYNWNYYDSFVAIARLAIRTGLSQFWDDFDQLEDWWHDYGIAGGYSNSVPRVVALFGVMVEALRGHPEMWNAVHWWLMNQYQGEQNHSNGFANPNYDLREFSYVMLHAAGASLTDPDRARHADYCKVLNTWTDILIASQNDLGYWPQDVYGANHSYPFQNTVVFPWHMDITAAAMEKAYESYTDATYGCNNPARAASVKTGLQKALDFMWNYGRNTDSRGPHYYVMSTVDGESRNGNSPGTVSWSGTGSTITGAGTSFTATKVKDDDGTTHPVCDGNHYIALDSLAFVARITGCQSDTQLTVSPPLKGKGFNGGTYYLPPLSPTGAACHSQALYCGTWGQDEARIMVQGFSWWAAKFGGMNANGVSYLSQADEWFSAAFGGPSDGPGGSSTSFGPGGNGYQSDWTSNLYPCSAAAPPCSVSGAGGPAGAPLGKNWGQGSGAIGAQNHLAWRILALRRGQ